MSERIFLTFTDRRMKAARQRICKQAKNLNFYTQVIGTSEHSLDREFKDRYQDILNSNNKGYGYYIWKPRIVKQILSQLKEGDCLHWLDAGSHLNPAGIWRLNDYFGLAAEASYGFLGFENKVPVDPLIYDGRPLPDNAEYLLTKGDLFDWFGVRDQHEITHSQQIGATTFVIRKCKGSVQFIDEWNEVFSGRIHLIDDSPSRSPNFSGFIQHRWDQSILSILAKLYGIETVSVFECWYPTLDNCWEPDFEYIRDYPIWMKRDRQFKGANPLYISYLKSKGIAKNILSKLLPERV
jgi:hypothetical protein